MGKIRFHKPYPKQAEFLRSRARYTAYGGARGGGKSDVAREKAILLCLRYAGIQVLFLRRTYPELKENHLLPAQRILGDAAKYNGVDKAFIFQNGSRLKFGYCKNEADLLQYQGQAYEVIFLEECTQFPEIVFATLTESNRSSGLMAEKFEPRMYFTCNPGGVGHAWFKRLFVDREYRRTERPEDYVFIQASVYDNPWLLENSPDYVRALENLPEDRRRAMLDGDWNVFAGQYFPEFKREHHVCRTFEIPNDWARYRVFDYGFDMFACYTVAVDPEDHAYFYKEIYEGRDKKDEFGNEGKGLTIAEAAERMRAIESPDEHIIATFAPPDMWNRRQDTGQSAADIFASYGVPITRTDNRRILGWLAVKDWLRVLPDGTTKINIFENCSNLVRTLPLLMHDEKNPNDAAKEPHEVTHAPDALRYFVAAWVGGIAPEGEREEDYIDYEEESYGLLDYSGG